MTMSKTFVSFSHCLLKLYLFCCVEVKHLITLTGMGLFFFFNRDDGSIEIEILGDMNCPIR